VVIDERTFLSRTCHRFFPSPRLLFDFIPSTRRSLIHCARRSLRNPRTGPGTRCESGQNGHTNRVPCAFGVFSTATAHPGLHNRYCTCTGGAATNRPAGLAGFAGRAGRADLRARATRRAVERVRLLLVALHSFSLNARRARLTFFVLSTTRNNHQLRLAPLNNLLVRPPVPARLWRPAWEAPRCLRMIALTRSSPPHV